MGGGGGGAPPPRAADLLALAAAGGIGALRLAAHEAHTLSLADALVRAGLVATRNDARRALSGGGVRINGVRAAVPPPPAATWFLDGGVALLSVGARRHLVVLET